MRIYYDCEFLENGRTIKLISIGLIREDGLSLYRIVKDDELMEQVYDHTWLRKNVVPSLPLLTDSNGDLEWNGSHEDWRNVKPLAQIATDVRQFITDTKSPSLWAYYAAYDHVALCQLFGTMIKLPHGIPMWTNDLQQELFRLGSPRVPQQAEGPHNALSDARWNKETHEYLLRLQEPARASVEALISASVAPVGVIERW